MSTIQYLIYLVPSHAIDLRRKVMLKNLLLVIWLICQVKPILAVLPSTNITIACGDQENFILFLIKIDHIQYPYLSRNHKIFLSDGDFTIFLLLDRGDVNNELFWINVDTFLTYLSVLNIHKSNFVWSFLIKCDSIKIIDEFALLDDPINFHFGLYFWFYIMFNLVSFTFQILQNSSFFNNIVGKLIPFHVTIPINIDLVEKKC